MRKHEAPPTQIMLDAEQMEADTLACVMQDGDSITAFNRGKHCETVLTMCYQHEYDGGVYFIHDDNCGLPATKISALA